ncbi:hydroxymethylglutaryl-CoA reductase, degradative [Facklamia sp. 7083-14-GEN3]|uniref:hydroxymethylglutaryl-CoA reductase, degradative n=1 Tax=Facklamia sp. 7083-14-GEN3 TaxID=2973478 RepID=UPI00215C0A4A|nr:hydroxymethylglutaryl-CoA reductase, degradative [Facklamia sp. 7083-14-GEN3]MCR8969172.1 hydroxymethylglutaryl-CoA reductase, degradative [Facklamia sp. 7083-14-GEN3]
MTLDKFYRQTIHQRRLNINHYIENKMNFPILEEERANQMIENYLYTYGIPMGILPTIRVNQKDYVVPMVTEEPSVIAAASNGAKHLGNIKARFDRKTIKGQIILTDLTEAEARQALKENKEDWLSFTKKVAYRMVERGGGPLDIEYSSFSSDKNLFHSYYLLFDPCEAMGANALNTVLEALATKIKNDTGGKILMAILSNFNPKNFVRVETILPVERLNINLDKAHHLAEKIAMASEYAQLDPYRATTHNKGIMNGVDAVLIATGNDWRAVEASVHAFASKEGRYRALSQWFYDSKKAELIGQMDIPLPVATVGGTLSIHPMAQWSLELMGNPKAIELAQVIASVGLAQNFAALKAIVSEGIQKGHMGLQARSLAIQVGAKSDEIDPLVKLLKATEGFNSQLARDLLDKMRNS